MILRFMRILNYVNTLDILRDKSKVNISKFRNKYLRDFAIKKNNYLHTNQFHFELSRIFIYFSRNLINIYQSSSLVFF